MDFTRLNFFEVARAAFFSSPRQEVRSSARRASPLTMVKRGSLSMAHYLKTILSMISSNYSRLTNCVYYLYSRCQSFAAQLVVHLTDLVKIRCDLENIEKKLKFGCNCALYFGGS